MMVLDFSKGFGKSSWSSSWASARKATLEILDGEEPVVAAEPVRETERAACWTATSISEIFLDWVSLTIYWISSYHYLSESISSDADPSSILKSWGSKPVEGLFSGAGRAANFYGVYIDIMIASYVSKSSESTESFELELFSSSISSTLISLGVPGTIGTIALNY